MFHNTTAIQPYLGRPGWNLITAMADAAIDHIKMLNEVQPGRPFMIYYAPGGTQTICRSAAVFVRVGGIASDRTAYRPA